MSDDDIILKAFGDALILRGENVKASCYVKHNGALGVLREKMVGSFIRASTPDKFRVLTGFIFDVVSEIASPQIDILICDCHELAPLYRWEDLVVVQHAAARAAVEVKTAVDSAQRFQDIVIWHNGIVEIGYPFTVPTFVYALETMTFRSAVEAAAKAISSNALQLEPRRRARSVPVCFVANDKHYIMVRPHFRSGQTSEEEDKPDAVCCIDFSKTKRFAGRDELNGIETGCFTQFYRHSLLNYLTADLVYRWYDYAETDAGGKFWIDADGQIREDSPVKSLLK